MGFAVSVAVLTAVLAAVIATNSIPSIAAAAFLLLVWSVPLASSAIAMRGGWSQLKFNELSGRSALLLIVLAATLSAIAGSAASSLGIDSTERFGRALLYGLTFGGAFGVATDVAMFWASRMRRSAT